METRKGGRLVDRPEFKTKPKPVTFLGKDKVSQAISVMAITEIAWDTLSLPKKVTGFGLVLNSGLSTRRPPLRVSNFYLLYFIRIFISI